SRMQSDRRAGHGDARPTILRGAPGTAARKHLHALNLLRSLSASRDSAGSSFFGDTAPRGTTHRTHECRFAPKASGAASAVLARLFRDGTAHFASAREHLHAR